MCFIIFLYIYIFFFTPLHNRAVLSTIFLKETLNLLGKVGCVQCILGSTIMVLHAPEEQGADTLGDLALLLREPGTGILC